MGIESDVRKKSIIDKFPLLNKKSLINAHNDLKKYWIKPDVELRKAIMDYIHHPFFISDTTLRAWITDKTLKEWEAGVKPFCEKTGGVLATPYTKMESVQARNLCETKDKRCRLGFSDEEIEGHFVNTHGVLMSNAYGFNEDATIWGDGRQDSPWKSNDQGGRNTHKYNCIAIRPGDSKYTLIPCTRELYLICQNVHGMDELPLIVRHRYGHILDKIEYEYSENNMFIKSINEEYYYDGDNISIDEYLQREMDKADANLEDTIDNASKDNCIKVFEYKGSINTDQNLE